MPTLKGKDIIAIMKKAHLAKFQKKTVTPNTVGQTIRPDSGYDGLSEVVIGSATLTAKKTVTPKTTAQTINPDNGDIGLLGVVVNATPLTSQKTVTPQIYSQTLYPNSGHLGIKSVVVNATPLTNQKTVTPKATSQTVNPNSGDLGIKSVVVNAAPLTSQKTVTPGVDAQTVVPDAGDLGLTGVVVEGDTNLISENIKENVSIFGVTGSLKGATPSKLASIIDKTIVDLTSDDLYGVINIRRYIFEEISTLKSVTIPSTVKTIEGYAFKSNYNLTDVNLPSNGQLTSIGSGVFKNTKITSITIPESLTKCYPGAFEGCSFLSTVNWNATECTIINNGGEDGLFQIDGSSNVELLIANIGANVRVLPDFIFYNCLKLKTVTIEENSQLIKIGACAFCNCDALTSIDIPDSVKTIGATAFQECNSLVNVSFGVNSQLETIGSWAFRWVPKMSSITIPSTVTNIGSNALAFGSSTLKATITMLSTTPPTIQADTFVSSLLNKIIVPAGCGDTYKAAENWSSYAAYIVEATE